MITANCKGNRVILTGGPVPGARQIPGAYANRHGDWTFPLTMETCQLLRQRLGDRLGIGPELREWAKAEKQRREELHSLSKQDDAPLYRLPVLAPALADAVAKRPYQRAAIRFIADARRVVLADDPGLGKTLEIIGGVLESGVAGPYLVVCSPKIAVHAVWRREIERWLPDHTPETLPDGKRDYWIQFFLDNHTPYSWLIINPEVVVAPKFLECKTCGEHTPYKRNQSVLKCGHDKGKQIDVPKHPQLFDIEWGAIIVDECHDSLIRRAGNPTQRRNGLDLLDVREGGLRLPASGTPSRNKPEKLWGALNWADRKRFSSYWNFAKTYWNVGGFSGWQIGEMKPDREQMLWDSLKPIVLRRTKAEVATDLPPKTYVGTPLTEGSNTQNVVLLPMEGKQARAYRQMREDSSARLKGGRVNAITPIAELTRLRQLAASYGAMTTDGFVPTLPSNKFEYLVHLLEQLGYPENPTTKVLVFSNHTKLLYMIGAELDSVYKRKICTYITGKTKTELRGRRIRRFNEADSRHVMLLNIKAGGTAITIDSADHSVFLDRARGAYLEAQAEDRTHRISNPRKVFYHYLVSEGTIDVGMSLANAEEASQTGRLMDVRRGIDYAKRALELTERLT